MSSSQFQVENIIKRYNDRNVIDGVSFNLRTGEAIAVTGVNGSGKSTLIKICAGILNPDSGGTLLFCDGNRVKTAGSRNAAVTLPDMSWYQPLTGMENIRFVFAGDPYRQKKAVELCSGFTLADDLNKTLRQYSSGMRQRFSLAIAFAMEAPLMILDEPTSFLDESGMQIFKDLFLRTVSERISIIATNDSRDASLCESEVRLG